MATTATIPPLGRTAPTTLKAPATSSTTSESASASKSSPARSLSSQAVPRRPGHPVPSDFLSDRATTTFIRRTLCAQHLADRGRNTPAPIEELLPPLTSRNDVDLQLYALISVILREFVQNWYNRITPDETFVAEIVQIIAHCTRALEQRLRKVDLESLLLDELPELLDAHVRAYRTARNSAVRPPIEANHRDIYHSIYPLPALSPVPRPDDARNIQAQADNETAYRQLLVQGVLALLLPTEDLENECLTSLVGQIFSELIIGNLVTNKLSEPWLILEILIVLTRLVDKSRTPEALRDPMSGCSTASVSHNDLPGRQPIRDSSMRKIKWSVHQLFWSFIQWGFLAVNSIRLIISTIVLSRSLPPRPAPNLVRKPDSTSHYDSEKSYKPPKTCETNPAPLKSPIVEFSIWACIANLLELDARMPWLSGALSIMRWGATSGLGRAAGYNGIIDRLLSHHIQTRLLEPDLLPPLLRAIRAALFPNNAPGASSLVAPSSDEDLTALRRRCANAIWALVPKGVGKLYFGSASIFSSPCGTSPSVVVQSSKTGTKSSKDRANAARSQVLNDVNSSYSATHEATAISLDHTHTTGPGESGTERLTKDGKPKDEDATSSELADRGLPHPASGTGGGAISDIDAAEADGRRSVAEDELPLLCDEDEGRILSEIESGILDPFSDSYCNRHLVYGVLELILVRLMPELAERGVIELWEERLS